MNLFEELDRRTAPPAKASDVRRLSTEEIEHLVNAGQITPITEIPKAHICGYEKEPRIWGGRGGYEH